MAITSGMSNQMKGMMLDAMRNDVFKIALFRAAEASIDKTTDTYSTGMAGELPTGGGYTQGGMIIPGAPHTVVVEDGPVVIGGVTYTGMAYMQFNSNPQWTGTTLSGVTGYVIYNASLGKNNKIVGSNTFAAVSTVAGPLTVPMPTTAQTALIVVTGPIVE